MFVIIVLGLHSFTFKDSRVLLTWRVDRWGDSSERPCVLASVPRRAHVKPFPWKLLFAEPDALCFSLCPPIAVLLVLLAHDPERPHGFQLCWGIRNTFFHPSSPRPLLWTLPLARYVLRAGPGRTLHYAVLTPCFSLRQPVPSCPRAFSSLHPTHPIKSSRWESIWFSNSGLAMADNT